MLNIIKSYNLKSEIAAFIFVICLSACCVFSRYKRDAETLGKLTALLDFFIAQNINNGHSHLFVKLAALFGKVKQCVKRLDAELISRQLKVSLGIRRVEAYRNSVCNLAKLL